MRSDAASIQEYHPENKKLKLLAHVGLHPESAVFWEWVDAGDASAYGRALMVNERIIAPEIEGLDADPPDVEAYRRSGVVAVQSTPLVSRNKRIVGMLSTHWRRRWKPSDRDIGRFDVLARLAADLIERSQAAAALRDSEARYRLLFNSIDESFTVVEPLYEEGRALDYRFVEVNPAFETITGLKNAIGRTGRELVPSLEREWIDAIGRVAATGNAERVIRRARALGKIYDAFIFRIDGADSGRVAILSRDVTERVRAEEERILLVRELNHRSKNLLSIVLAIARAAGNQGSDFEEKFQERILSLSANQDLLVANDWQGVSLSDLVRSQLAHLEDLIDGRITVKGSSLIISAAASQSFSMALHELATNAVKYGALSNDDGRVEVDWGIQRHDGEGRRFTMRWRETDGPPVTPPERTGFGSTVIRDMIRLNLRGDAKLNYDNSGVVWEFDCPIENVLEGGEGSDSPAEPQIAAPAASVQPNL
ncbi:PAS domain S-box protein [Methylocystis sp. B8]|nr:PAS domain S-box protein [Methylocystis sp. B8]